MIESNVRRVKSDLPCNAGADLRRSPDFFVDEKIEKGQEGERYDVHEDKIHPGHVDLARERLQCSRLLVNITMCTPLSMSFLPSDTIVDWGDDIKLLCTSSNCRLSP